MVNCGCCCIVGSMWFTMLLSLLPRRAVEIEFRRPALRLGISLSLLFGAVHSSTGKRSAILIAAMLAILIVARERLCGNPVKG